MVSKVKPDIISKSGRNILEYFDRSHRYKLNQEWVKSITGVGKGYPVSRKLIEWQIKQGQKESLRIMNEAGDIGTIIHDYIYHKRMGKTDLTDLRKKIIGHKNEVTIRTGIKSANEWLKWTKSKLVKAEVICASTKLQVAGKFDEVAKEGRNLDVVDYKTSGSLSLNHFQQAAGYKLLINEWFKLKPTRLKLVHILKDDVGFHEAVISNKGFYYDGKLEIEDPDMLSDMEGQFIRNIPTSAYLKKYEHFYKKLNPFKGYR